MCPLTVVWFAGFSVAARACGRLACARRVGWLPCCLFGGESGCGFLVFGHGGNRYTPGRDVAHPGIQPEHVTTPGGSFRVIVVNAVVVGAQEGEVFNVGESSCLPGDEVVDLAVVRRLVTPWSGTGLGFGAQADALFPAGMPLNPIRVHRAFKGVDDGGVANLGKLIGQKVCPGHACAVGEVELYFLPITVNNLVELVEGDNDLGMYGGFRANAAGDNDGAGSLKQVCFINGFEGASDISDDGWVIGDGDGVRSLGPVGEAYSGLSGAFGFQFF